MNLSSKNPAELHRARPLLSTIVEITVPDVASATAALDRAFAVIAKVHSLMSAHDQGSDLGRLDAASPGSSIRVHPWTWRVLSAAKNLNRITAGAFDPIAAGRLALAAERLPRWRSRPPSRAAGWGDVEMLSKRRVRLRRRIRFDLGGIAKGFAVDRAVQALRAAGMAWGLVNAGGDLRAFGSRAWPIHVRCPSAPGQFVFVGSVREQAVATSAPYFSEEIRAGRGESALFDPISGRSITGAISVSVFAHTCLVADALTKAVLTDGDTAALRSCRARTLILTAPEAARHAA